jgi:beta-phosphoglucomutase
MIKAIIFDLDGVLVSTDHFHYLAWKKLADREGIEFDEKINNRLRGVSRMASLDIILEKAKRTYTPSQKEEMAHFKNEYYVSLIRRMTPEDVEPVVLHTLETLKKRGLKLAVASSSKNAPLILKVTGLTSFFDVIVDGTMIKNSKPDPEVFLLAQKLLQAKKEEALVVEDAVVGIEAAHQGGMKAAAIKDATKDEQADYLLSNLGDLLEISGSVV